MLYFGENAGELGKGYYSYDLGAWHVVVIDSNFGTGAGSPQLRWLQSDLATNRRLCTLAYWHHPRFSSGRHGNHPRMEPVWEALYEAGADVVISGHDHTYERFARQAPDGTADPDRGIRQFVVGTGGAPLYEFCELAPNSEVRENHTHGVIKLTLHPTSYDWEFIPVAGKEFRDSGSEACH